jgi:hypothetical protein
MVFPIYDMDLCALWNTLYIVYIIHAPSVAVKEHAFFFSNNSWNNKKDICRKWYNVNLIYMLIWQSSGDWVRVEGWRGGRRGGNGDDDGNSCCTGLVHGVAPSGTRHTRTLANGVGWGVLFLRGQAHEQYDAL